MNGATHFMKVKEKILAHEDLIYVNEILRRNTEFINARDLDFFKLVDSVIVGEDQEGKIVDSLRRSTNQLKRHNFFLIDDVNTEIKKSVNQLNEQAEQMKSQWMTIHYEDNYFSF